MSVILQRVYLGFLAFFIAETLAGSSPLWIINRFWLIVTFPLYLYHFLFFTTMAMRTGRTSLPHLYLWGMLLGLYETWITKVIWAGYQHGGQYALGQILGFGIHETIVLVLFWHPFFAFIIPLLISVQLLGDRNDDFIDLKWFLTNDRYPKLFRRFAYTAGIFSLAFNTKNPFITLATTIPGLIILYFGYRKLFSESYTQIDVQEVLNLKDKAFTIVTGYLVLLYILTFFFLLPEDIPGAPQILITLGIYGIIIYALKNIKFNRKIIDPDDVTVDMRTLMLRITQISVIATISTLIFPIVTVFFIIIILLEIPFAIYSAFILLRSN